MVRRKAGPATGSRRRQRVRLFGSKSDTRPPRNAQSTARRPTHRATAAPQPAKTRHEAQAAQQPDPAQPPRPPQSRRGDGGGHGHRVDIEGLRAVAVLLVLAYHAGIPLVAGGFVGVDVFFVISGYLITGLIVREVQQSGRLSLARFYARRARRLLPATAVVLTAVAALTVFVLPPIRRTSVAMDIAASSLYAINWRLAGEAVDYMASEQAASPVQHFWSLAVEEQFYLVWPVLILALVWWHRRSGWSLRRTLLAGLAVLAIPSLAWSVTLTQSVPGRAYLVSTTRAWELGVGAAVAVGAAGLARLPRRLRWVGGWVGAAAIVLAALTYDSSTLFPGYAALLPTLGAALVIIAGLAGVARAAGTTSTVGTASTLGPADTLGGAGAGGFGVGRLLAVRPLRGLGALSYSVYLWHWPLLVAATAVWGDLSVTRGAAVATASLVPAWLTYRLVESPIRRAGPLVAFPRRALILGAACTTVGVAAAVLVQSTIPGPTPAPVAAGAAARPVGAAALTATPRGRPAGALVDDPGFMIPDPISARDDKGDAYRPKCHQYEGSALQSCAYGDLKSRHVMALVGDSHAAQWEPTLAILAKRYGWRLETYTKSACGFFTAHVATGTPPVPYTSCTVWNTRLLAHLTGRHRPDLVVTSGSNNYQVTSGSRVFDMAASRTPYIQGLRAGWQAVHRAGVPVVVIRNTPWIGIDVPDCLSANPRHVTACAVSRTGAMARAGDAQIVAAEGLDGVKVVKLTNAICPGSRCAPVIGHVIVWRDAHHLTATYARTLTPLLDKALAPLLGHKSS